MKKALFGLLFLVIGFCLGVGARYVLNDVIESSKQFIQHSQIEIKRESIGSLVSIEELPSGSFEQQKSKVTTSVGTFFVAGLASGKIGSKVYISKRLTKMDAICITNVSSNTECYWRY